MTINVRLLLFETFGDFADGVVHLLRTLALEVSNCLSHAQSVRHEHMTSYAARNWKTYQGQRLSVALHRAAAEEIATELGLAAGRAVDPGDQRAAYAT